MFLLMIKKEKELVMVSSSLIPSPDRVITYYDSYRPADIP